MRNYLSGEGERLTGTDRVYFNPGRRAYKASGQYTLYEMYNRANRERLTPNCTFRLSSSNAHDLTRLGAGMLAPPIDRATLELHAQAKAISRLWQTINHFSDLRKLPG